MNRVVLSGSLATPPQLAHTVAGIALVVVRLRVSGAHGGNPCDTSVDELDCVAIGETAVELAAWGEYGHRLTLEGRLRSERCLDGLCGMWVFIDHCYFVDPVKEPDVVRLPIPAEAELPTEPSRMAA